MGNAAYRGATMLQQEGMAGVFGRSRDMAANFGSNPEVRERAIRIGTEVGGAAVRGALLETGAKKENGKWSVKGILKSIIGLKTGAAYAHAAKGAYRGARAEGVVQWGQHGEALRGAAWGATQEAFTAVQTPDVNPNAFNPFAPSAPSQFAPVPHVPPYQVPPRYVPMHTVLQSNPAPSLGHNRAGATPFDAGYSVIDTPFGTPGVNALYRAAPPSAARGTDMRSYF